MPQDPGTPHVRDVGVHQHMWAAAGEDPVGVYEECSLCGARRMRTATPGVAPGQTGWLAGGAWAGPEVPEDSPAVETKSGPWAPELGDRVAIVEPKDDRERMMAGMAPEHADEQQALREGIAQATGQQPPKDTGASDRPHLKQNEGEEKEPTDSQVRSMSKPKLVEYGKKLGLELSEDEMSQQDMVDEILAARSEMSGSESGEEG